MVEIHYANEKRPILTRYEPGFRRVYAKGSLLNRDQDEADVVRLAFWSNREKVQFPEGEGVGYLLEMEAVMSWDAAERLHGLLGDWLERQRPDREKLRDGGAPPATKKPKPAPKKQP